MYTLEDIQAVDPEIAAAITAEFDRQNSHIELIASENWVSPAVMSAMGSILALIVPGPGKYLGCFCRDSEFFIPWAKVIRIGPDIILVEFDEKEMKHRIKG